jgi:hypothetical protein
VARQATAQEQAETAAELERREQQQAELAAKKAHKLDEQIRKSVTAMRSSWVPLAKTLDDFNDERAWELLGADSLEEYLAQPEVELKRSTYFRLIQVHREFVVERDVSPARLKGLDYTKLQVVIPKLKAGEVDVDQALSDVQVLGRRDLEEEYRRGGLERGLDDPDPERVQCEVCGAWHDKEKAVEGGWYDQGAVEA